MFALHSLLPRMLAHLPHTLSLSQALSMHLIRNVVAAVVFACGRLQMSQCARKSLFPPTILPLSSAPPRTMARQAQNKNQNIAPTKSHLSLLIC